jgi:hypothetical protein
MLTTWKGWSQTGGRLGLQASELTSHAEIAIQTPLVPMPFWLRRALKMIGPIYDFPDAGVGCPQVNFRVRLIMADLDAARAVQRKCRAVALDLKQGGQPSLIVTANQRLRCVSP